MMMKRKLLLALGLLACLATPSDAGEILYADGRTGVALEPRQDSAGRWTAEIEGHRIRLEPGRIVAVIDDEGTIAELIPALGDQPLTAEAQAILATLREPKNGLWQVNFETIAGQPSRAMLDDLVELAGDKNKALRLRAVQAMARLYTRESVTTAARTVLAEKHKGTRGEAASALFSVREIFTRSEAKQLVPSAVTNDDKTTRVIFALLGAAEGDEAVLEVLRKDGVRSRDHHIREEAALALAKRGDSSGLTILTGMLSRKQIPGLEELSDEARTRMLIHEHVQVCEALAKLGDKAALSALRNAAKSDHPAVGLAAKAAIEAIEG
jgi:HEAT repeat protein